MADSSKPGRFVWHDLMTYDRNGAVPFYTKLLGWKTREQDVASADYVHFLNDGKDIAGAPKREKDAHAPPPHWLAYVTVDDVDATCAKVKSLGGQVHYGPVTMERVGTFAVIADPTGGVIAAFKPEKEEPEPQGMPAVGTFCWDELATTDPEKAVKFYSAVFGWTFDAMDMGPMGTYHLAKRNGQQTAGVMKNPPGSPPMSYWLHYIATKNVDGSTRNAREIGAKVLVEPMDIPNIGRFSVLQDPAGAVFALFQGNM